MIADMRLSHSDQFPKTCLYRSYPVSGVNRTAFVGQQPSRIGRGADCEISLNDELISRVHAIVAQEGDFCTIRDQRSRNGTLVNGVLTDEARLRDGDIVYLGNTVFRVVTFASQRALEEKISYIDATMDAMTNSHRFNYFVDLLQREFARIRRYRRDLSVMVCRPVPDSSVGAGGQLPAALMQSVLTRLLSTVRAGACVSRLEGQDAIAIFLPECRDVHVRSAAQRFRDVIAEKPFRVIGGHEVQISLQVHGAYSPVPMEMRPQDLLCQLLSQSAEEVRDSDVNIVSAAELMTATTSACEQEEISLSERAALTWTPALSESDTMLNMATRPPGTDESVCR